MVTAREVQADKLVSVVKEDLKKVGEIKPPVWATVAKSSVAKNRPPEQEDFWFMRAASVLRRIYMDGPVGVAKLRTAYGGRKKRGTRPPEFRDGGGSILRKVLQQLETAGYVEKSKKGVGRKVTPKGQKLLDNAAYKVMQAKQQPAAS
jgi:small subunit ribosomal protein S19e